MQARRNFRITGRRHNSLIVRNGLFRVAAPHQHIAQPGEGLDMLRFVPENQLVLFARLIILFLPREDLSETHSDIVIERVTGQEITIAGSRGVPVALPGKQLGHRRAHLVMIRFGQEVLPVGRESLLIPLLLLQGLGLLQNLTRGGIRRHGGNHRGGSREPARGECNPRQQTGCRRSSIDPSEGIVHP